jgi:hypothetical protein
VVVCAVCEITLVAPPRAAIRDTGWQFGMKPGLIQVMICA